MKVSPEENLPANDNDARANGRPRLWKVLITIVLVVAVGLVGWQLMSRNKSTWRKKLEGEQKAGGQKAIVMEDSGASSAGSEAHLYIAGYSSIMVAVDEQALNELVGALTSKEDRGQDLILSGRALSVPNNTRVSVLETGPGKTKIRILEGEHATKEGWVLERWIK